MRMTECSSTAETPDVCTGLGVPSAADAVARWKMDENIN